MEPTEIVQAIEAFTKSTGGKARSVYVGFTSSRYRTDQKPVHASVHADRPTDSPLYSSHRREESVLRVEATTWAELFELLPIKWQERQAELDAELVHKMGLAIISLTEKFGECLDAALRGEGFSDEEVTEFGPRACDKAGKMASNGPFKIGTGGKANQR